MKQMDFSLLGQPKAGAWFANAIEPMADVLRGHRAFFGDSVGFLGATAGNNASTGSWVQANDPGSERIPLVSYASTALGLAAVADLETFYVKTVVLGLDRYTQYQRQGAVAVATSLIINEGDRAQWLETAAQVVSTTTHGIAVTGAATDSGGSNALGLVGYVRQTGNLNNWAGYFEGVRTAALGSVWGIELAVYNFHAESTSRRTPYAGGWEGQTIGQRIQSGGGNPTAELFPADVALEIGRRPGTGQTFKVGINMEAVALEARPADASVYASQKDAMLLPTGAAIRWFAPTGGAGSIVMSLVSSISAEANAMQMKFNDSGISFVNDIGEPFFFLNNGPNTAAVNYLSISSAGAGLPPTCAVAGPDTNIGQRMNFKGTGTLNLNGGTLPLSAAGLAPGDLWKNGNYVMVA